MLGKTRKLQEVEIVQGFIRSERRTSELPGLTNSNDLCTKNESVKDEHRRSPIQLKLSSNITSKGLIKNIDTV
jgi:hypothetical protein